MNYAEIKTFDVANGPGIRVSLFVSGCNHRCPGCFNEQAWDFNFGQPFTQETIDYIIDTLSFGAYQGVTFLGGEPMEPVNQKGLLPLARKIKETYPEKDIWCFTGYDFEKASRVYCGFCCGTGQNHRGCVQSGRGLLHSETV